jgi:hypothetical protein
MTEKSTSSSINFIIHQLHHPSTSSSINFIIHQLHHPSTSSSILRVYDNAVSMLVAVLVVAFDLIVLRMTRVSNSLYHVVLNNFLLSYKYTLSSVLGVGVPTCPSLGLLSDVVTAIIVVLVVM